MVLPAAVDCQPFSREKDNERVRDICRGLIVALQPCIRVIVQALVFESGDASNIACVLGSLMQ